MEARAAPGHFPIRLTLTQEGIAPGRSGPSCPARRKKGNRKGKRNEEKKKKKEEGKIEIWKRNPKGKGSGRHGTQAAQQRRPGPHGPPPPPGAAERCGTGPGRAEPSLSAPLWASSAVPARPSALTFFLAAASLLCLLPSAMSAPRPGHVSRRSARCAGRPGSAPSARPTPGPGGGRVPPPRSALRPARLPLCGPRMAAGSAPLPGSGPAHGGRLRGYAPRRSPPRRAPGTAMRSPAPRGYGRARDYNSQRAPRCRHRVPGVPRAVPAVRAGRGGPGGAALFPLGARGAAGAAEVGEVRFAPSRSAPLTPSCADAGLSALFQVSRRLPAERRCRFQTSGKPLSLPVHPASRGFVSGCRTRSVPAAPGRTVAQSGRRSAVR